MTDYTDAFDHRRDYTDEELLRMVKASPLAFAPGERYQYSNLGYLTLGFIISKVAGKPYYDFMHERVFKPLGMNTARIISEADITPNRAAGYRLVNGEVKNQRWVSPSMNMTADGSFYFSILDMVKWEEGLSNGKLLSKSGYDAMWTEGNLNDGLPTEYGFGWGVQARNGRRIIDHGGRWQGFISQISRYVDDKITLIFFANLRNADEYKLINGLAKIFVPGYERKPIYDPSPLTTSRHKALLMDLTTGSVNKPLLSQAAIETFVPLFDKARKEIQGFGEIEKFELVDRSVTGSFRRYQYRVQYKSEIALFTVTLDKAEKVAALDLRPFQ